jgi:uncharacterized protein
MIAAAASAMVEKGSHVPCWLRSQEPQLLDPIGDVDDGWRKAAEGAKVFVIARKSGRGRLEERRGRGRRLAFSGASPISGEAHGIADVMKRAKTIAAHGVRVEIICPVYGYCSIAMILHNTGSRAGRVLDEHVAAVFSFRGDKVSRLDTHLSDVAMAEAFFA